MINEACGKLRHERSAMKAKAIPTRALEYTRSYLREEPFTTFHGILNPLRGSARQLHMEIENASPDYVLNSVPREASDKRGG